MRQGTIFTCERCGARGLGGGPCIECGGRTLDENGHELLPRVERERRRIPAFMALVPLSALVVLIDADGRFGDHLRRCPTTWLYAFLLLGFLVAALPSTIRAWRARPRRPALSPIGSFGSRGRERVRIRGRVRLLDAVASPEGKPLAAREERRAEDPESPWKRLVAREASRLLARLTLGAHGDALPPDEGEVRIRVDRLGGRYLVEDGTGLALVDEDAFVLRERTSVLGRLRRWLLPAARTVVELRDGDLVEVEGPASLRHGAREVDFGLLAEASYRTLGPSVLVFEGAPLDPLRIVAVAREAPAGEPSEEVRRGLTIANP